MNQRKKLSVTSVNQTPRYCFLKYTLMACNAFGIMLGIFVVLFGISYPDEGFPGGYSGKTTAGISGVFIFFTGIGYCGASNQKAYFLLLYSFIIIIFLGGNVAVAFISPSQTLFHPLTKQFYVMATIMLIVLGLACVLAWQVKHDDQDEKDDQQQHNSSINSGSPPSYQQLSFTIPQNQQNQQNQQSQQNQQNQMQSSQQTQQQLQSPSNPSIPNAANGSATHHYQQPSLQSHFQGGQMLNNNCMPQNQPITMAVKQQFSGANPSMNQNSNLFFKNPNVHSQMPGVYVQQQLPAIPPRYSQANGYS